MLRAVDFFVCLFLFSSFFSEDGKETVESKLQMPYAFDKTM